MKCAMFFRAMLDSRFTLYKGSDVCKDGLPEIY